MDQARIQRLPEVFFDARAADDIDCDAAYAALQVTEDFCTQIRDLQQLCIDKSLKEIHVHGSPDRWGPTETAENICIVGGRELVISDRTFYFVSDEDRAFVTAKVPIEKFLKAMRLSDGQPVYFSNNIGRLQDLVEGEGESEDDEDDSGDSFSL